MKSRCLAPVALIFAALSLVTADAPAGPNAGGVLIVHDAAPNPTCDPIVFNPVPVCENVDNEISLTSLCPTWKVYAAFPPDAQPRLKSLRWGIDWPIGTPPLYVGGVASPNPQAVTVVGEGGWPITAGSGATMTFATPQTGTVVELYCFVAYFYTYGDPVEPFPWSTTPHPSLPTVFVDDAEPPVEDPIADFGALGFGMPGYTPCPAPLGAPGEGSGGEQRAGTWGSVKNAYR